LTRGGAEPTQPEPSLSICKYDTAGTVQQRRHAADSSNVAGIFTRLCRELAFDCAMFPYTALASDKSWQPGPYEGVELLVLHKNDSTGGVTVLRKFRAGLTVPAHVHPDANELVYVLSGEWEESGAVYRSGAFFFAPKGIAHGPHFARSEVISLTIFDGPLSVVPS
jgi:quercetin dioxygenase-like cupin family protein